MHAWASIASCNRSGLRADLRQGRGPDTLASPGSDLEPVCSLQEAVFFVVRILVGFMPRAVGNKIIHVCSLPFLASHSLHTVQVAE